MPSIKIGKTSFDHKWGKYTPIWSLPALSRNIQQKSLHWRHIDQDGVSYHQPHGCLLNRLFRRRSKKTSKLRATGLCAGKSPGPVNSPHKGPVTRKMILFDDVIMSGIIFQLDGHRVKKIGTHFFGQLFWHHKAQIDVRNTKMNRRQETHTSRDQSHETHPIRVNARYQINRANS